MKIRFFLEEIKDDIYVRDNFKRLQDAITAEPILKSQFEFFEITAGSAVTNKSFPHNLGYRPKDVILTAVSDGRTVTFAYDSFTATNIVFTTSGACTFRCFIGTYREGTLG